MDLNKLTQIITEDDCSKFNVNKKIKTSVPIEVIEHISQLLKDWYRKQLLEETLEEIALATAVCIYSISKSELLTTLAGRLGKTFNLPTIEGVELSLSVLGIIDRDSSLVEIYKSGSHLAMRTILKLDTCIQTEIDKVACLPPLITQPNPVVNNYSSGHLTINKSLILGSHNDGKVPQNLHFINTANSIKFSLNEVILDYIEETNKPLKGKDRQAFDRHVAVSEEAYIYLLENGNEFYLTHNYDNRGREYCDNWQVNYQGTDYKKALCHLNKKELIQ